MSKRTSPEGSDDPDGSQSGGDDVATKRRKYCEFESVRLLSISSVNDIDDKKTKVQVYKLSETLRNKDRIIAEKDREIERLRERQYTDENTSYTINRYWMNLDEQMRAILMRSSNPDVQLLESNGDISPSFLEEVVQMSEEDRQKVYEKRVNTSVRILEEVLQLYLQRTEQTKTFAAKLNSFMSDMGSKEDFINETVHLNASLSEENNRLTKEINKIHGKYSDIKLKLREYLDKISILETKNDEQVKEINDLKHDLGKANRLANKLDFKLWSEIKERRKRANSANDAINETKTTNGAQSNAVEVESDHENNGFNNQQLEELRFEADTNQELAATRLAEINELNEKLRRQAEELQRIKIKTAIPSVDNQDSEEMKEIKMYLTLLVDEVRKKTTTESSLLEEMDLLREDHASSLQNIQTNYDRSIKKLQQINDRLTKENESLRSEVDTIRNEYELAVKSIVNSGTTENKDIKTIKDSYKAQIAQIKSELNRMRKKWKESVTGYIKITNDLYVERNKYDYFYVCPKTEVTYELTEEDENDPRAIKEKFFGLLRENASLRAEIKRQEELDESSKKAFKEAYFGRKLEDKDIEIVNLNAKIETLSHGDETVTNEMETIGRALEDLQEQNAELIRSAQHHEEEKMKMMGDKITSGQIEIKLREEKSHLEIKVEHLKQQLMNTQNERQYLEETQKNISSAFSSRCKEATVLRSSVEIFKKQTLEKAVELSQLKSDKEKLASQVKTMQETIISKNQQNNISAQKVRRLEEENSVLKKKLDRLKRCEKLGSTDAVMSEEIRQLKEALTCPSCKVNRKDAILTKCFHVFCMKCLKTRYDTRQRKCPKCNAGFGANDFQRAYIG